MERDKGIRTLEEVAEEIDRVLDSMKNQPEDVLELVSKLKKLIEEFHYIPLVKMVRFLKSDPHGKTLLLEMVKDADIYALFLKHGIVKPDLRTQVAKIIELIRPYIRSHGGDVEFVDVKGDTVVVRLKGACQGCSQVGATLQEGILEAIREHVPEIKNIELAKDMPVEAFVDLNQGAENWKELWDRVVRVEDLKEDEPLFFKGALIIRHRGVVYVYRNSCAHQGMGFEGGEFSGGKLVCPWHGFEYDVTTGECVTAPQLQLEPIPSRIEEGWLWIKL